MVKMTTNGILCKQSLCHTDNVVKCRKWDVSDFLQNQALCKYAVVVLNRTISQNPDFIKSFWNNASIRITVDGGTVHWEKFLSNLPENEQKTMRLPDLITGDFDSITQDVLQKYKKKGCKTIHTIDQNYTDFTKALIELNSYCIRTKTKIDHVVTIVQSSGRIDQILGNIQTLHLVREKHLLPESKIYIMSDDSMSWLLDPGDHIITVPKENRVANNVWCSLVPVGEPCQSVTTSGLKWNLDKQQLKFGHIVSTSNTFDGSEQVKVKCSHTVLWSMRILGLISKL